MRIILAAALIAMPGLAFAAGGGSEAAPKPTKTSKDCKGVRVWDIGKQRCVKPKQSSLDEQGLYEAVRELAYAGRYHDAQGVLAAMPDQKDDRVLTYYGFTNRKLGDLDTAMMFYTAALDQNPDNMLARSYMGQGMIEAGDIEGARLQLAEIETRGGGYTWAGTSLRKAIYVGKTYNY
ncbi:MAG: tetratricopeptide repeat protein [Aliishimia sp.]